MVDLLGFVRVRSIQVTPTISTSAYSANDAVGGLMTFSGALISPGGTSFLLGWKVFDKKQIKAALDLFLYNQKVTVAADNAAFALSDADAANIIDKVSTSTYLDIAATSSFYRSWLAAPIALKGVGLGNNIYGSLRATGTPTYTGTDDLVVELIVGQIGAGI